MEIFLFALNRFALICIDGATHAIQWERTLTDPLRYEGLQIGDPDDDGVLEIAASASIYGSPAPGAYVDLINASTGAEECRSPNLESFFGFFPKLALLRIADVDDDGVGELLVAERGDGLLVLDPVASSVELGVSEIEVTALETADLDGDGVPEIVIGNGSGEIQTIHPVTGKATTIAGPYQGDIDGLAIKQLIGDSALDFVFAVSDHLYLVDGATKATYWESEDLGDDIGEYDTLIVDDFDGDGDSEIWVNVGNPAIGVTAITTGDSDGDEVNEILFSAGTGTSENFNLFVVDSVAQDIEWESVYVTGPFYGFAHGDIDGDSQPEIIFGSHGVEWTVNSGLFFVRDAVSKTLENQPDPFEENCARWKIQVANVDGDPASEIFATCYGRILCMDGATLAVQWQEELPFGLRYEGMEIGDPDDDGDLEIVASVGDFSSGVPGIYVDVFDASTGEVEWRSPDLEPYFGDFAKLRLLRIADIDDDSVGELLVAERFGGLQALDPESNSIQFSTSGIQVSALDTADLNDDGIPEIIVGNTDGEIQTIHPVTGAATTILEPYGGEIDGLVVKQMFGGEALDYLFAVSDRLYLVDGDSGHTYWTSDDLGDEVGENDSIVVDDFESDGVNEIWVNGGYFGHMIFEIKSILMKSSFEAPLD